MTSENALCYARLDGVYKDVWHWPQLEHSPAFAENAKGRATRPVFSIKRSGEGRNVHRSRLR